MHDQTVEWWVDFRNDAGSDAFAIGSLTDFFHLNVLPWCRENIGAQLCGTVWRDVRGITIAFGAHENAMLCYLRFA